MPFEEHLRYDAALSFWSELWDEIRLWAAGLKQQLLFGGEREETSCGPDCVKSNTHAQERFDKCVLKLYPSCACIQTTQ